VSIPVLVTGFRLSTRHSVDACTDVVAKDRERFERKSSRTAGAQQYPNAIVEISFLGIRTVSTKF